MAHRPVLGVENQGGKAYGKATGLYNMHRKNSEQCNPWHPFWSAYDFQWAQSFSSQTNMWMYQHLRHGLENFKIEPFQSADALWKLLSQLDFWLRDDGWIEDDSAIFEILCYRDILICIQVLLAHHPFRAHLEIELVGLACLESRLI